MCGFLERYVKDLAKVDRVGGPQMICSAKLSHADTISQGHTGK
jgi:hypothetical protein